MGKGKVGIRNPRRRATPPPVPSSEREERGARRSRGPRAPGKFSMWSARRQTVVGRPHPRGPRPRARSYKITAAPTPARPSYTHTHAHTHSHTRARGPRPSAPRRCPPPLAPGQGPGALFGSSIYRRRHELGPFWGGGRGPGPSNRARRTPPTHTHTQAPGEEAGAARSLGSPAARPSARGREWERGVGAEGSGSSREGPPLACGPHLSPLKKVGGGGVGVKARTPKVSRLSA